MLLFLVLFCMSGKYCAQGFQVNFQGQKQQAMGSIGCALPQDAASLFYNPGISSFLLKSSATVALTPVFANTLFEEEDTRLANRTNSPIGTPFSAYGIYRPKTLDKWTFGIATYTPFGSAIEYESGWVGRFILTRMQLKTIFIQPSVSLKLNDHLGIGAGFIYCKGNVRLQKDLPIQFSDGSYARADLAGEANTYGFNIGFYTKVNDKISMGASFRSGVKMAIDDGMAEFTVPSSLDINFPDGSFSSTLSLPFVATFGTSLKPDSNLVFAADVNYTGWRSYDTLAFDYLENTESLVDTKSQKLYKNTFAIRVGVQYLMKKAITLRAGLVYGMTPVPDNYVSPETPDANRINYSIGFTWNINREFEVDGSLFFTHLRRIDTNAESGLSGTYTTNVIAPGLGLTYKY